MEYEKNKDIQLLTLSGTEYVLVRRKKYDELLDKLEAIDTALDIARSRTDASEDLLQAMLKGDFSVEQIRNVSKTKTLGERLRLMREMRNLGQRDLSEKTGVSQATISNLENNRISEPSFQALDAIFQGLDVPGGAVYPLLKSLKSSS
jgi:DNA-binding XRE family transcriptional regulator